MGNLRLYGSTSGYVEIAPPAVGGSQVLTLPTDSVQPGLVLVNKTDFSAVSSVSVNNCFTSTYSNYVVYLNIDSSSASSGTTARLRVAGSDDSSAAYRYAGFYSTWNATVTGDGASGATSLTVGTNDGQIDVRMEVFGPQRAIKTSFAHSLSGATYSLPAYVGRFDNATQFDGISFIRATGTITGTVRVYGLRNS